MTTGYALDLISPIRYVATELDRAGSALSISTLATTYRHPIPGDLSRIQHHEKQASESAARMWLIQTAVERLERRGRAVQLLRPDEDTVQLAVGFAELRYEGKPVAALVDDEEAERKRKLKGAWSGITTDRTYHLNVLGPKAVKPQTRPLKMHPLSHSTPVMREDEFYEAAADMLAHGVEQAIELFEGAILDGRHRAVIASTLGLPVRIAEFTGTEDEARDHVMSLNVHRRHMTNAQRALMVAELYMPVAKQEAEERKAASGGLKLGAGRPTTKSVAAEVPPPITPVKSPPTKREPVRAAAIASQRSGKLATEKAVRQIDEAAKNPKVREAIVRGEITSPERAVRAKRIAEGKVAAETKVAPIDPRPAYRKLGSALGEIKVALESVQAGNAWGQTRGGAVVTKTDMVDRINEMRSLLDQIENALG